MIDWAAQFSAIQEKLGPLDVEVSRAEAERDVAQGLAGEAWAKLKSVNANRRAVRAENVDLYHAYLESDQWEAVRQRELARCGNRCEAIRAGGERCGRHETKSQTLHVHHETYERLGREEDGDLRVLCGKHHREVHLIPARPAGRGLRVGWLRG